MRNAASGVRPPRLPAWILICAVRVVERGEEGKPDDVVLVQMAEQDVEGAFGSVNERIPERREAAARIDDEQPSVDPDFDASGIAAVNERARAGNGN